MSQNIYDDPDFFAGYSQLNRQVNGLDGAPEWPTLRAMVGQCTDQKVVDLGCGFGWFSRWAIENGATTALGIDLSERMLARAAEMTASPAISYQRSDLDELALPPASFNLAFSSLTLHYVHDLDRLLQTVHDSLTDRGRVVFSVEHPIFSASTEQQFHSLGDGRQVWPIDNYLAPGPRSTSWFTDGVIKQHRTVAGYLNPLVEAGFAIERIDEFGLTENADDVHRPWFLLVSAHKT